MENYKIITDSSCDLPEEIIKNLDIDILPLKFTIKDKTYSDFYDRRDMSIKDFYNLIRNKNQSITSQINPEEFKKAFLNHIEKDTDVLYLAFSSKLSGTCGSAQIAAKEILKKYPERKILIIDTLSGTLGQGMLVMRAVEEKRKNNKTIEELEILLNKIKLNVWNLILIDDLNHLQRGGRISLGSAFFGSMLNIKPVLYLNNSGELKVLEKVRGKQKLFEFISSKIEHLSNDYINQPIFISHSDCEEEANKLANTIKQKLNIKEITISPIGPVLGSHTGPGTLSVCFMGIERQS